MRTKNQLSIFTPDITYNSKEMYSKAKEKEER